MGLPNLAMKMKESRSRKHKETYSRRNEYDARDSITESHSYRNVLKERHYKESLNGEKSTKKIKEIHSKHSSHSKKRSRSESPHHVRRNRHRSSPEKAKIENEDHKHRKHQHKPDLMESYEELSRRKRRIESELHALDLEEAAEKEAENKTHRQAPDRNKKRKVRDVHIKHEKVSDSEEKHIVGSNKQNKLMNEDQKSKQKHHASKSSGDEKSWGKTQSEQKKLNKEKPNFSVSGKLAEDTNTFNGVVIKYNEPAEARKPRRKWRLYPFKGDSDLPFIPIHRQSAYLFGRSRLIADIPIDHPSCSKQHAVLQFRLVSYKREDGTTGKRVRPYIIDLESSNGTFVNNKKIEPRCYVELMEKDVVKFGYSSREYVVLHEESKDNFEDDDVIETNE